MYQKRFICREALRRYIVTVVLLCLFMGRFFVTVIIATSILPDFFFQIFWLSGFRYEVTFHENVAFGGVCHAKSRQDATIHEKLENQGLMPRLQ